MHYNIPAENWLDTVAWMKNKPEEAAHLMQRQRNWRGLFLFDALEHMSDDRKLMDNIVRGLLRVVLWLKFYNKLHGKVFLHKNQIHPFVLNFVDSSKLIATNIELTWGKNDLYGMLWHRLINAPEPYGAVMREICMAKWSNGIWLIADEMKRESEMQRKAFEYLTGPYMGKSRNSPYSWMINKLIDMHGRISPDLFLDTIHCVAENSSEKYYNHPYALHYECIKDSIHGISSINHEISCSGSMAVKLT